MARGVSLLRTETTTVEQLKEVSCYLACRSRFHLPGPLCLVRIESFDLRPGRASRCNLFRFYLFGFQLAFPSYPISIYINDEEAYLFACSADLPPQEWRKTEGPGRLTFELPPFFSGALIACRYSSLSR